MNRFSVAAVLVAILSQTTALGAQEPSEAAKRYVQKTFALIMVGEACRLAGEDVNKYMPMMHSVGRDLREFNLGLNWPEFLKRVEDEAKRNLELFEEDESMQAAACTWGLEDAAKEYHKAKNILASER